MLGNWPTGSRDTAEFPQIEYKIRDHLRMMLELDGIIWNDQARQSQITGSTPQRIRTYRKMYEKLGLLYKDEENKIRLSVLGQAIKNLEGSINDYRNKLHSKFLVAIVKTLARYQFNNPVDHETQLPPDCDVKPFLCMWIVMTSLDNKLHNEEINRTVFRIMKMSDIEPAIDRIRQSRAQFLPYSDHLENLDESLGEPVLTDQVSARLAAWCSAVGWGDLIITGTDSQGFRHLRDVAIPEILKIQANPPAFFHASSSTEWYNYYLEELHKMSLSDFTLDNPLSDDADSELISSFLLRFNENIVGSEILYHLEELDTNEYKVGDEIWALQNGSMKVTHVLKVIEYNPSDRNLKLEMQNEILPPLNRDILESLNCFSLEEIQKIFTLNQSENELRSQAEVEQDVSVNRAAEGSSTEGNSEAS